MPMRRQGNAPPYARTEMMPSVPRRCPFCSAPAKRILLRHKFALAVRDAFPISPGHTLQIPRRHVCSFFETTEEVREALLKFLDAAKKAIERHYSPDGYNMGINDRAAAGQTVPHPHVHLIPQHSGDHPGPRGGVGWVLPSKANYWS